jgi:kynureninase
MTSSSLDHALALDSADPLRACRASFALPEGLIYLDGNSLGALPVDTPAAVAHTLWGEWGDDLIASWNSHDWIGLPQRLGNRISPLIGAGEGEVVVCDSTSVNLYKLIVAALTARPGRKTIVTEAGNFPTDIYVAQGAVATMGAGHRINAVAPADLVDALNDDTALLLLTHVHYSSGRMHNMEALTRAAHTAGALILWDLSHSAGAVPVDLTGCDADLAVGCGYKYFNGGPGAPAFLYIAERLQAKLASPLSGWMGHAEPFAFEPDYRPAHGIDRFLCGTPSVLAMTALDRGIALFEAVDNDAVFAKGRALGDHYIALMDARCADVGFTLASPRDAEQRGSHVSYTHDKAWPICRALAARKVVGDFRAPDVLRMGFAPLYTSFSDVWRAVDALAAIIASGEWDDPRFHERAAVT